jgi:large subunit ribosomal protein L31
MKPGIQPDHRPVIFRDRSAGYAFLTRSIITSDNTVEWPDGNTYPVVDVGVSSASHPAYTGRTRVVDIAAESSDFRRRYGGYGR